MVIISFLKAKMSCKLLISFLQCEDIPFQNHSCDLNSIFNNEIKSIALFTLIK